MLKSLVQSALERLPFVRRRMDGLKLSTHDLQRRIAELELEAERLLAVERTFRRWEEFETLVGPLADLRPDERRHILSDDHGLFTVGTRNAPTRDLWVEEQLKALKPGYRLLDAGAGECQYKKHCGHLEYVAQDVAVYDGSGDVGYQNPGWSFSQIDIVCDILDIPEPDASYDAVLCTEVFEHLPDPVRAIDELSRLIKPGGILIATAPFWSMTHQAPYHFATGFNRFFYEHHLARNGFDIVELTPNGNYFECVGQEIRRVPEMASKFAGGPPSSHELRAIQIVLSMVQRLSAEDRGSTEMLSYGYQVRAVKWRDA